MSSVSFTGALTGASSSSSSSGASAARRAASAGASFGLTLQSITDRANAEAQAAQALTSGNESSVHDAPEPDDSAAKQSDDAQASSSADASDAAADASKPADKTESADGSKATSSTKPGGSADAAAKAAADAKARADAANAASAANADANSDAAADDTTLADLADAATGSLTTVSTDDDASATGDTKKTGDAKSAPDALQAALAAMSNPPAAAVVTAASGHAGAEAGKDLPSGGKGARGVVLTNASTGDGKNAAAAVQGDATAVTHAQAALTPVIADGATAAYKQAADAAAHAVAMQTASAGSVVSNPQGAMTAATSAAIAPHVGGSGWDDAFSQKVVFLSNADQQSAELTLNPKDLGPLQVTLQVADNHAHALFVSQHAQVREAVEAAMPKLREAMEANGISLGSASVSDGSAFGRQDQGSREQGDSGGRRGGTAGGVGIAGGASGAGLPVRRVVGLVDTFA
ncbi:flagellar hook-length control protein FliK [Caballeronia sp. LZ016]|uniref:flagellar hook-length control protein FliK n=1 Tax=Caballeronia sp. LZ016 TaxID=3038554 RepID=UPI002864717C|nr:flagellar hook-length control protein FliK [Caballeronia sp. LZ016]MDR5737190.1 flagellar hook-length control protein FliK [Caballeronia sp. LZ016]